MIDAATPGLYLLESPPGHPIDVFTRVDLGVPASPLFAKAADEPNTRWITLKPHGDDSDAYVHVKIRMNADGTGNVVSGKGGLRGLKLTRLASTEELKERAKVRAQERKEKKKREKEETAAKDKADLERAAEDPEFAQKNAKEKVEKNKAEADQQDREARYQAVVEELQRQVAKQASELTGDDRFGLAGSNDEEKKALQKLQKDRAVKDMKAQLNIDDEDDVDPALLEAAKSAGSGASLLVSRDIRSARTATAALEREIIGNLVKDDALAKAVLQGEEVVEPDSLKRGQAAREKRGYKSTAKRDAKEKGYEEGDAKDEAEEAYQERLKKIAEEDPERAAGLEEWREKVRDMNANARALKTDPDYHQGRPETSVSPDELQEKAEKVREFLTARRTLREAEAKLRAARAGKADPEERDALLEKDPADISGTDLATFQIPDEDFAKDLEARISDAAEAALTMQFLEAVENTAEEATGLDDDLKPTAMNALRHHVASGSMAHLANVALTLTGAEGVDRMVADSLGLEAAAALTAHMLRRDLNDDELTAAASGLDAYHGTESLARMRDAMDEADAARAEAAEIDIPPVNGTVDAALVSSLMSDKRERLEAAQSALGSALGQVEAGAALNLALAGKGRDTLKVDFGLKDTKQIATTLRALGLEDDDYKLTRDAGTNVLTATVTKDGMDKLSPAPDPEVGKRRRDLQAIKDGAEDEDGWVPHGFATRSSASFEPGEAPPALRGEPAFHAGRDAGEALGEYAGSLFADGMSATQMHQHLSSQEFLRNVPDDQRDAFQEHLERLLPAQKRTPKLTKAAREKVERELREAKGSSPSKDELEKAIAARAETLASAEQHLPHGHPDRSTYVEVTGQDLDAMDDVQARLQKHADAYLEQHFPGETSFHGQRLDSTEPHAREALFRAVADSPNLQAAYHDPSDIGGSPEGRKAANAIRQHYRETILEPTLGGTTWQEDHKARRQEYEDALGQVDDSYKRLNNGQLPEKFKSENDAQTDIFAAMGGGGGDDSVTLRFKTGATDGMQAAALAHLGLDEQHYARNDDGSITLTEEGKGALDVRAAAERLTAQKDAGEDAAPSEEGPLAAIAGGLESINPQYLEHVGERLRVERKYAGGRGRWAELVEHAGSPARAYAAVQEHMRGSLASSFSEHYGRVKGKGLRASKMTTEHHRTILKATNEEALEQLKAKEREIDMENRERAGGRFAAMGGQGALTAMRDESHDQGRRNQLATESALFSMEPPQPGLGMGGGLFGDEEPAIGGESQARQPAALDVGADERVTLGHTVEQSLRTMLQASGGFGIQPGDGPTDLIPDVTFGGESKHVGKQRFIKGLEKTGKLAMFFGTGSGKTATQLGAFTHLHGAGKAKKGLFIVPSSVRNQFGTEATRFLEPGQYKWHAHTDSFDGRKAAYRDDTHMIVTTHATFRDDMVKLMAEHVGSEKEAVAEEFRGLSREQRRDRLKAALDHHEIDAGSLFTAIDEGHQFLNRAGKADSLQSNVLEALLDNVPYAAPATGSPIKNDLSEAHDWLAKLDPKRFSDRDAFMRKYGTNTEASREGLRRLMGQYSMVDATTVDVPKTETWGRSGPDGTHEPIPLTEAQQGAYSGALNAFERASRAARSGRVDVDAIKELSPNSFAGLADADHADMAARLNKSLGTLKHSALARAVNEHPADSNAKVQHTLKLAADYAKNGKAGVIFAFNKGSVSMLRDELTKAGHKVGVIDGSASSDEKAKVRQAFDAGEVDIVVASDAGQTGMNLQKRGRWLVHYDLPHTKMASEQRSARIDRLGQEGPIDVHHLQTDTPYDNTARRRIERKARLGSSLQGEYESLDDTGLARYMSLARAEQGGMLPNADPTPAPPVAAAAD